MGVRTVKAVHPAFRDDIADLRTRRALPGPKLGFLDPFLFLNHHGPQTYPPGNRGLPFGPHPHRGFETVTFIVEGELAHRDSGGHDSVIETGGVQWMTAGRGLVHAEVSSEGFKARGGDIEILQLWVNLPARLKMTTPRYVGLQKPALPSFTTAEGAAIVPVSGDWLGHAGPIASLTDVHLATIALGANGHLRLPIAAERTVLLYVIRGEVSVAGRAAKAAQLVELNGDGDEVDVEATTDALLLVGHAAPLGEPIVASGPFVMNTRDEIAEAIRDYQAGKFGGGLGA